MLKYFYRKNSTLPKVKFQLTEKHMERYGITDDMLLDCAVTFSMKDVDTGRFAVANNSGELVINDYWDGHIDSKYVLVYRLDEMETDMVGNYIGEFVIDFLSNEFGCGKIKLPHDDSLMIIVNDTITKTTVV